MAEASHRSIVSVWAPMLAIFFLGQTTAIAEAPYQLDWTRQLGTSSEDQGLDVSVDASGNAYITGLTYGSLGGPNAGNCDAFLAKYDASGNVLWTRQLGTESLDHSTGVSVDGSGNAYITGSTLGSLAGPSAGQCDTFLAKYDPSGNVLWTRQLGTDAFDYTGGVSVDAFGNAYITGLTDGSLGGPNAGQDDAFLAKYDAWGNLLWLRELGRESEDGSNGVSVDAFGNAYINRLDEWHPGGAKRGQL